MDGLRACGAAGARFLGMEEVRGSIPLRSTRRVSLRTPRGPFSSSGVTDDWRLIGALHSASSGSATTPDFFHGGASGRIARLAWQAIPPKGGLATMKAPRRRSWADMDHDDEPPLGADCPPLGSTTAGRLPSSWPRREPSRPSRPGRLSLALSGSVRFLGEDATVGDVHRGAQAIGFLAAPAESERCPTTPSPPTSSA